MPFDGIVTELVGRTTLTPETALYGYVPTRYVCYLYLALFGVSSLLHFGQSIYHRTWWMIPTAVLCGALECLGWAARLWNSFHPTEVDPFKIQITATIIAPTPLLAANFIIFGRIIDRLGPSYSRVSAKWYTIAFTTCDVISLLVQGLGGAKAATSAGKDEAGSDLGGHIMLGGICFQMFTITLYAVAALEYFIRYASDKPVRPPQLSSRHQWQSKYDVGLSDKGVFTGRLKMLCYVLLFSTTCLWVRAVYRLIELAEGWGGRIIKTQVYFNVLDAAMVVLAMYIVNFLHPGWLLSDEEERNEEANQQYRTQWNAQDSYYTGQPRGEYGMKTFGR